MKVGSCLVLVALAAACSDAPGFRWRVTSHHIRLEVYPEEHRLVVRDRFEIESGTDGLSSVALLVRGVTVDSVSSPNREVTFRQDPGVLRLELDPPLGRGDTLALDYAAHADEFLARDESRLIEEVAIQGQVRPQSSFSSHTYYYPVDARNDATVAMAIWTPKWSVAVSGGESIVRLRPVRTTSDFEGLGRRPRLLPFGFAVARYRSRKQRTPGGVTVELHYLPGAYTRAPGWLDAATAAAAFFEETMGPLPWSRVAVCQVAPIEGEAGCSLPGQILFSERLADDDLFADEMSHQWNAYLAPLPNELAEGFATYSVALFHEREKGVDRYRREIASYRRMLIS